MCVPIVLVAALLLGIIGVGSHVNFVPVPVNVCGREMVSFVRIANVVYPNASCASRHVLTGVCGNRRSCSDCGKWYVTKLASGAERQHRCGHSYCSVCRVMMPEGHECYMQPAKTCKDEFKSRPYVFYDFESMMLEDGRHQPNLCVVHRVCTRCMDLPMEEGCRVRLR